MRGKIGIWLLTCLIGLSCAGVIARAAGDELITSPHGVLMEASTGKIIYEKCKDEQKSPASITKIMTLLLIFEELEKGNLTLDEEVTTSAHAKSMGGSQVFLEEGERQTVETLIKCIVIASGNDASVAMAEHIAGSEEEFVRMMNERAKELGMEHTNFEDCCGLTDSPNHYTTAYDVALMSRELVYRHPKILDYSSIWMEDITHETARGTSTFTLSNTNKFLRSFDGCVGLKTGSTSTAKYCVSNVAIRDGITLIAVVLTAPDYKVRFRDSAAMLNYGFSRCSLYVDDDHEKLPAVSVRRSEKKRVSCRYASEFRYLDTEGDPVENIEKRIRLPEEVSAPLKEGQKAGEAVYYRDGQRIGAVDLVYGESAERASCVDCLKLLFGRYLLKEEIADEGN